jgi:hypothetical protein
MPVTQRQGPIFFHKPISKDWGKKYDAIFRKDTKEPATKPADKVKPKKKKTKS